MTDIRDLKADNERLRAQSDSLLEFVRMISESRSPTGFPDHDAHELLRELGDNTV